MNLKYIFIILILAILVGGGILWWATKQELPEVEFPPLLSHCERWYNDIEEAFQEANFCERDQDCKDIALGGPYVEFGCYKFVNIATDEDELLKRVGEYDKECAPAINKCALAPGAACVSNKCIVKTQEAKNCDFYEMPMTGEQIKECTCPEGYKKFYRLSGAYCATDSQKPCRAHTDCPEGEHCISSDRQNWFCTGQFAGCYYRNPEDPEEPMFCAD